MATKAKPKKFADWAYSHSMHNSKTKLPFSLSIKMNEDVVDFIHGSIIGMLIGLVFWLFILKTI
jgi:uncharacterized membrane protein